jgi:hypothetical protein
MAAIQPAMRLNGYPDELIDSTDAALRFIEHYDGGSYDLEATALIELLRSTDTPELADAPGEVFRDWAEGAAVRCHDGSRGVLAKRPHRSINSARSGERHRRTPRPCRRASAHARAWSI